jgi:hypothetical protein
MQTPTLRRSRRLAAVAVLAIATLPQLSLGATRGELDQLLDDLTAWLPGEYSSAPLARLEEESGVAPEKRHRSEFWILARVDAPQAGSRVVLQEVHAGGEDAEVALEWQMLHALRIDTPRDAVVVERRAMLAPDQSVNAWRDTARQRSLAFDQGSEPACDWLWRRRGSALVGTLVTHGTTQAPCVKSTGKDAAVVDSAEWILTVDELWIRDAPTPVVTRKEQTTSEPASTFLRLFKARRYGCSWNTQFGQSAPLTSLFEVHDRGGEYRVDAPTGGGRIVRLMRGPVPTERLRGQREVTSLGVLGASNRRIYAESRMSGTTDYVTLRFADQLIECARR